MMLEFLKNENISDETINYLDENLSLDDKIALKDNQNECIKILMILKKVGLKNVEDLLKYVTYIFYNPTNEIVEKLKKCNMNNFIKEVNEDCLNIENYL